MTSSEIRQSYLDFFKSKQHTIVPSSSLMPDSPNLLFTNAGMNQFVPIFLGETKCPYKPGRAADTQKCIRAGGKHNDLEDVGLDTYHHTFFEMLGNWSFGDYFKKEAIEWAWELIVGIWKFPPERIYATVYKPGKGDPAEFDQEAYDCWEKVFKKAGLDPKTHICYGGKKDNFWMMGDTGPCGPCSELHIDLTPDGDTQGKLVNVGDARCMEIWNLVFIQFNANPDGTFSPLPAKHVDTGMGFERVCGIMQNTKNFTDFKNAKISNYESDVFYPIFREIEKISGKTYKSTLPAAGATPTAQEKIDIAFRVIADHIRTLGFAIADGIIPGNNDRGYVIRRVLRRAVRYGYTHLGIHNPFLYRLVDIIEQTMSNVFPELRASKNHLTIKEIIRYEEESFSTTLEDGIDRFETIIEMISDPNLGFSKIFPGDEAFKLYDTYGFPIDLTQLMAREKGIEVDIETFNRLMEEQRKRSRDAQKKDVIRFEFDEHGVKTESFCYDQDKRENLPVKIQDIYPIKLDANKNPILLDIRLDQTPFYAEMGGQVGDQGYLIFEGRKIDIIDTQIDAPKIIRHIIKPSKESDYLCKIVDRKQRHEVDGLVSINTDRRKKIEGHHTGTHLLHWALRKVLGDSVQQKGSFVGDKYFRFDFAYMEAMTPEQINKVEELVNNHITARHPVIPQEKLYTEIKNDPQILQFFGEKYGEKVRVIEIRDEKTGKAVSKELCGGTHVSNTKDIGFFKIISEGAIAAGVRRIEAISGEALREYFAAEFQKQDEKFETLKKKKSDLNVPWQKSPATTEEVENLNKNFENRREQLQKIEEELFAWEKDQAKNRERELDKLASAKAPELLAQKKSLGGIPCVIADLGEVDSALLPKLVDVMKTPLQGVIVLASHQQNKVSLIAAVANDHTKKIQAGKIIQQIAPLVGGKGGGRPELAQGGGTNPAGIADALKKAEELLSA